MATRELIKTIFILAPTMIAVIVDEYFFNSYRDWLQNWTLPSWLPVAWVARNMWWFRWAIFAPLLIDSSFIWAQNAPFFVRWWLIITLFVSSGIMNVLWAFLFFKRRHFGAALGASLILIALVDVLILMLSQHSWIQVLYIAPYLVWVVFVLLLSMSSWAGRQA